MNIYSIKNEKLGFFNRPIYCESNAEALSYIQNVLMSDADRALLGLKSDLALYFLGSIDFSSGQIITTAIPIEDGTLYSETSCPLKICDLEDIFNTIPADKIPRSERQISENLKSLYDMISVLRHDLETLTVDKKGKVIYASLEKN